MKAKERLKNNFENKTALCRLLCIKVGEAMFRSQYPLILIGL